MSSLGPDDRGLATSSAIVSLSTRQPQQAADLYSQVLTQAAESEQPLALLADSHHKIAAQWSQHAPQDAAVWAENLPDVQRADAYHHISLGWVQRDLEGAARWIDELPVGKARDKAVYHLVERVKHIDPQSAYEWAASTQGDVDRANAVHPPND